MSRAVAVFVLALASAAATKVLPDEVRRLRDTGSDALSMAHQLGTTTRRVYQICGAQLPIHPQLEDVVRNEAARHGPNYGETMLSAALRSHYPTFRFPRQAVRDALRLANPSASADRHHWAVRRIERGLRGVYYAPYFMYSLHIDLACKLQQYFYKML